MITLQDLIRFYSKQIQYDDPFPENFSSEIAAATLGYLKGFQQLQYILTRLAEGDPLAQEKLIPQISDRIKP